MRIHEEWLLTPQRIAIHEPTQTAVIADLHLGYVEARRYSGDAIPLVQLDAILKPLGEAIAESGAKRLVIAGDLFEKMYVASLWHELLGWLQARDVVLTAVVPGNHDRAWNEPAPLHPDGFTLGRWLIVHGHVPSPGKRLVMGHWHPAMHYLGSLSPCYLVGDKELVLPAYSQDAAGVNVWPIARWQGYRCLVIDKDRVVDVGMVRRSTQSTPIVRSPKTMRKSTRPWKGRTRPG